MFYDVRTSLESSVHHLIYNDFFVAGGPAFSAGRRKSVFAETYDPEEDEHEEKTVKQFSLSGVDIHKTFYANS